MYKFTDITPKHTFELFDKLILPILNYGAEIWGFRNTIHTERIHLHFCKKLLGVKRTTQNNFVYGDTGRSKLMTMRILCIIKYWLKLCSTDDSKYCKKMYNFIKSKSDENPRLNNWATNVQSILCKLGFRDVWLSQGVGNEKLFLSILRQRVSDIDMQERTEELNASTRAIFYRHIYDNSFSKYLEIVKVKKYRIALSRLRLSSHRLAVESGRWRKPNSVPFDERVCSLCNVLEDEFHFVLQCRKFSDIRPLYIKKYYWRHPSMFKFLELIKCENVKTVRNLATYTFKAFSRL